MSIIAIVRGGRLETERPVNLADGTVVHIDLPEAQDDGWDNSPEGITEWLTWLDSLEPLELTEAERLAWENECRKRKEWEKVHFDKYSQELKRLWE